MTTTDAAFLTFPKVASCSQLQHHQFLLSFRTGVSPGVSRLLSNPNIPPASINTKQVGRYVGIKALGEGFLSN